MPALPNKVTVFRGAMSKTEATYGTPGAFVLADHGLLLAEEAVVTPRYRREGTRAPGVGTAGQLPNVAPSGFEGEVTLRVEMRGRGTAYSASNLPELDALLQASGHSSTLDATPGAEKVTYAPISDMSTAISAALELYGDGEKYPLSGVFANFEFDIDVNGASFAIAQFAAQGILATPTDVAPPAIVYDTLAAPVAQGITLDLHGFGTAIGKRVQFNKQLTVASRGDLVAADGHAGFAIGRRDPQLIVTIEAPNLTDLDVWALWGGATQGNVGVNVVGGDYNKFDFTAPQAQLMNVERDIEDPVALKTLTFKVPVTGGAADDDYTLVFKK